MPFISWKTTGLAVLVATFFVALAAHADMTTTGAPLAASAGFCDTLATLRSHPVQSMREQLEKLQTEMRTLGGQTLACDIPRPDEVAAFWAEEYNRADCQLRGENPGNDDQARLKLLAAEGALQQEISSLSSVPLDPRGLGCQVAGGRDRPGETDRELRVAARLAFRLGELNQPIAEPLEATVRVSRGQGGRGKKQAPSTHGVISTNGEAFSPPAFTAGADGF